MKVVVTGASGFTGKALCASLKNSGHKVIPVMRSGHFHGNAVIEKQIGPDSDWEADLAGCDAVIHLAARVHVMHEKAEDALTAYREVNTLGTLSLAQQAAASGVKRFIFLSSIKANGEGKSKPYLEKDQPDPQGPYAISKWEAEQGLLGIAKQTDMEVVIIRPPLVYGPGVKANFLRLMQWVSKGYPLPFGALHNQRSMIYLENLIDVIQLCLTHEKAANQTFLVSDGIDVSTQELIQKLGSWMQYRTHLLPLPPSILKLLGRLTGKKQEIDRMLGTLTVDSSKVRNELGWTPPYALDAGLAKTVEWFRDSKNTGSGS